MDDDLHYQQRVLVTTSARLHLGFFDLNGEAGRRFGSLGLSLQEPETQIELALAQGGLDKAEKSGYILKNLQSLLDYASLKQSIKLQGIRVQDVLVKVHSAIPRHSGLGSGTQMALAMGAGLNQLLDLNLSLAEIAAITGRGLRSGIGIGTFATGGLVLDGGRGPSTKVPPIIAQADFPPDWRILLIFDRKRIGTHGVEEQNAFAILNNASAATTAANCWHVLMQALPALKEQDFHGFSMAIAQLQTYTGNYFASAQGGLYASASVAKVLEWLIEQGYICVGQTSWGPTGFAMFENVEIAEQMLHKMQADFANQGLDFLLCQAKNTGATINALTTP